MHGIWFVLRAKANGVVRLIKGENPFTDSVSIQSIIIKRAVLDNNVLEET